MIDKNTYPKISIITPSYNQGEFIERTILSIINQEYTNFEYIVIDGGSTDNSVDIIKKYSDRITYWISEKDKGTYEANNKGLAKVTGDYWCVVNSDDLLAPGALAKIAEQIKKVPNAKWFAGEVFLIDEDDVKIGQQIPVAPNPICKYTFLNGCWISHPGVFLHKDTLSTVGYFEKYHLMDLNYWLRMEHASYNPVIVSEPLASLRMHRDCKSSDRIKLQGEFLKVYSDFILKNNINNDKLIAAKIKEDLTYYHKLKIMAGLIKKDKRYVFRMLITAVVTSKKVFFDKWFWGAIKRLIFGLSNGDAMIEYMQLEDSKANWN